MGANRYAYSANDPVNKLDPSGNEAWDLLRGQEESDRANAEAAQDALFVGQRWKRGGHAGLGVGIGRVEHHADRTAFASVPAGETSWQF